MGRKPNTCKGPEASSLFSLAWGWATDIGLAEKVVFIWNSKRLSGCGGARIPAPICLCDFVRTFQTFPFLGRGLLPLPSTIPSPF